MRNKPRSSSEENRIGMVKAERLACLATLYITGCDTLDMESELMFNEETAAWQFHGFAGRIVVKGERGRSAK